ncbi:MAG: imidazole glycerol phosphate synthase, glutamine amidotransferase subunit [Bacteroidetes bacterium GWF2_33_16]|nr:MAG: imidazole glycerol phosphate synthase, glutamine amidotransferase subunit [Bacteroidetes bacterium GWE2_32_14]OFY02975.1 MAG: imidazole glycerol phosphate synthase, glutamine amidotransferase subunit [Bacteroidetes bacterium GWF2_33_16]
MKIAIINYNAGNITSVAFALQRLGINPIITDDPEIIKTSDKVIFPGVGEASSTMKYLKEDGLDILIPELKQPVLGICLGMQLMCSFSEEGETPCLGIFDTNVKKFNSDFKVPHVGWNSLIHMNGPLFKNLPLESYVYFVHSYYAEQNEYSIATSNYHMVFSATMQKNNFYATQFHPERSGKIGELILKNFIEI